MLTSVCAQPMKSKSCHALPPEYHLQQRSSSVWWLVHCRHCFANQQQTNFVHVGPRLAFVVARCGRYYYSLSHNSIDLYQVKTQTLQEGGDNHPSSHHIQTGVAFVPQCPNGLSLRQVPLYIIRYFFTKRMFTYAFMAGLTSASNISWQNYVDNTSPTVNVLCVHRE